LAFGCHSGIIISSHTSKSEADGKPAARMTVYEAVVR
jgi:hypothetical protein